MTDQNEMVNVGIRCNEDLKNEILVYIKSI